MERSTRGNCFLIGLLLPVCAFSGRLQAEERPPGGHLMTRWAAEALSADVPLAEYPRPGMVREAWLNLNGSWDYAIRPRDEGEPAGFDGEILVPFPAESALSGVRRFVGEENRLWYRREFVVPEGWGAQRVLLHFGAVDWETTVWVNGAEVGAHRGGYDAFSFDITEALKDGSAPQEIVVAVWDPTDKGPQARGKQVCEPKGIRYTAVTGIWQTVWLEPVPACSIRSLEITPDVAVRAVRVLARVAGGGEGDVLTATVFDGDKAVASGSGPADEALLLWIEGAKLWSPDSPFLYGLRVGLGRDGGDMDDMDVMDDMDFVESYFGMREIAVAKDLEGVPRLALNGEILFQYGPLDQGWWPDGLYTAPTDEALRYDVEMTKRLGCNMIRKHVKVEPARWYYHCDRLGVLVWQDMASAAGRAVRDKPDPKPDPENAAQFERELKAMIDGLRNHPSIVMWVPFNEGWGQYDTVRIANWIKEYDPTRLVNNASGWADRGAGDVYDAHRYPGPAVPQLEDKRAFVQGEFGGLGLPLEGHLWWNKRNWGYRTYETREALAENYERTIGKLRHCIAGGTAAAVYTQTTDVEGEVNGLMTYDRATVKFDVDWLAGLNQRLYLPPPIVRTVVPTSRDKGQAWRYTTEQPPENWAAPSFDDAAWREGPGVLGSKSTPGANVRTPWTTPDIWVRRAFEWEASQAGDPQLTVLHDEDAEIYINGVLAAKMAGYTGDYIPTPIRPEAKAALAPGGNVLAAHCRQTDGGQSIDVGIVMVTERE
jgi:hypothetical protein